MPEESIYRGKVFTEFTLLIINNLSVYTKPYIFCKGFTSLAVNDLSVYINVNVGNRRLIVCNISPGPGLMTLGG